MARRRYTPKEKATAAGLAVVRGPTEAERQTGIPRTTIQYWMEQPQFVELRQRAREAVADDMWAAIQLGLRSVAEGFADPDAPLRDKATALGVLYDRHALLTGGATARSENRDITGTLSDAELAAAIAEAERLTGEGRASAEATGEATD